MSEKLFFLKASASFLSYSNLDPNFNGGTTSSGTRNLTFNFLYFGSTFTTLVASVHAYIYLNNTSTSAIFVSFGASFTTIIYGRVFYRPLGKSNQLCINGYFSLIFLNTKDIQKKTDKS